MPKTNLRNVNWEKVKQKYLAGNIKDVAEFLRHEFGTEVARTGTITRRTKGWRDERAELKEKALEEAKKKIVSSTTVSTEKLLKMKENVLIIVGNKLAKNKDNLSASEIKTLWEIIKVEVGEPTTIAKNENTNKNFTYEDLIKALDDDE